MARIGIKCRKEVRENSNMALAANVVVLIIIMKETLPNFSVGMAVISPIFSNNFSRDRAKGQEAGPATGRGM